MNRAKTGIQREYQEEFGDDLFGLAEWAGDDEDWAEARHKIQDANPNYKLPACGDRDCCSSNDPFDQMTFGKGKLSFNGYWEFPCIPCAKEYVSEHPECAYASTGGVAVLKGNESDDEA